MGFEKNFWPHLELRDKMLEWAVLILLLFLHFPGIQCLPVMLQLP